MPKSDQSILSPTISPLEFKLKGIKTILVKTYFWISSLKKLWKTQKNLGLEMLKNSL